MADGDLKEKLERLAHAWRGSDLGITALLALRAGLEADASPALRTACAAAVEAALAAVAAEDRAGAATAVVPAMAAAMGHPEIRIRERAATSITTVARQGGDASAAVDALARLLEDPEHQVASTAARSLWIAGLKQPLDLAPVRERLEQAGASHPKVEVRRPANLCLNHYLARTGEEPPLACGLEGDSYTTFTVSRRRTLAAGDEPLDGYGPDQRYPHPTPCGACGSQRTRIIWFQDDSFTGGTFRKWEHRCQTCGRYTLEEYDD